MTGGGIFSLGAGDCQPPRPILLSELLPISPPARRRFLLQFTEEDFPRFTEEDVRILASGNHSSPGVSPLV